MAVIVFDEVVVETDKAVLMKFDKREVWLPKSQISWIDEAGGTAEMSWWLIVNKGLECFVEE